MFRSVLIDVSFQRPACTATDYLDTSRGTFLGIQNMSPIQTFDIALDIRAGRIPVRWSVRDHHNPEVRDSSGKVLWKGEIERVCWPQVELSKWGDAEVVEVESPLDLRAQL